ncbi:methionine-rich copper-binding protein CopC [Arthrobacter sp. JUb119]|nr:methionine-rich copper-binding protein CopC [Arthrobacter sp. JUb119]PQZ85527.1 hypothetical protein CQ016_13640 [Arthrobacter sp. MYb222]PRB74604.1 hypothetical protein CQ012_13205 [Arthrobacter sp. MYb214]TDU24539.1 hypothetical protein EDF61_10793 [Arthrobacter sp. JUb115]
MKGLKMLAVAALVLAPLTAVAAPASAASSPASSSGNVATPAGFGSAFSEWFCKRYGVACP